MFRHPSFVPFGLAVWIAVFAGLLGPDEALRADTFSVGTSGTCTHDDLPGAIAAAAATAGSDTIRIVDPPAFTGPLTLINEAPVTLSGTLSCTSSTPQSRSLTISGAPLGFQITGGWLQLINLTVTHAGGVAPVVEVDAGLVTLVGSTLQGGGSFYGGNVHLGAGASIQLQSGSVVRDGEATFDGGGIYCTGGGTVFVEAGSGVSENLAARGGGIFLDGCTLSLSAGGPAPEALALDDASAPAPERMGDPYWGIWYNQATAAGGGVYAQDGADIVANRASIRENRAEGRGAGLYLTGSGTSATLTDSEMVRNFLIDGSQGAAAVVANQATLLIERSSAPCDAGYRCSLLDRNQVVLSASGPGGMLKVESGGKATIRQTMITGALVAYDGGGVALVEGSGSEIRFEGVMFTQNSSPPLVWARNGGKADLRYVSVAENYLGGGLGGFVKSDEGGDVTLLSSVVIESPGEYVFGFASVPGTAFVDCLLTHDNDLAGATIWHATDPSAVFADPASGDLRLRSASAAIDHCDDYYADPVDTDIEIQARGVDVPSVPNTLGYFDLGADEWHPIFVDGFGSGNTTAWSATAP